MRVCEPQCRRDAMAGAGQRPGVVPARAAAAPRRWGGVGLDEHAAKAGVDRPWCGAAELRACVRIAGCATARRSVLGRLLRHRLSVREEAALPENAAVGNSTISIVCGCISFTGSADRYPGCGFTGSLFRCGTDFAHYGFAQLVVADLLSDRYKYSHRVRCVTIL